MNGNKIHLIRKPVSISSNVMSLISALPVDGNGVDLFTMQSAKYEQITTKFTLSVKGAQTGPGVRPVDKSFFRPVLLRVVQTKTMEFENLPNTNIWS